MSLQAESCAAPCMSRQLERSDNKMSANNGFQVANIPWRNNNFTMSNKDPPFSDQGETIIGIYLLVLGGRTCICSCWNVISFLKCSFAFMMQILYLVLLSWQNIWKYVTNG